MEVKLLKQVYDQMESYAPQVEKAKNYVERPIQYVLDIIRAINLPVPSGFNKSFDHFKGVVAVLSIPKSAELAKGLLSREIGKAKKEDDKVKKEAAKVEVFSKTFFEDVRNLFTVTEHLDKVLTYTKKLIQGGKATSYIERFLGKPSSLIFKAVVPFINFGIESYNLYEKSVKNPHLVWLKVASNVSVIGVLIFSVLEAVNFTTPYLVVGRLVLGGVATLAGLGIAVWKDFYDNNPLSWFKRETV